MGFYQFLHDFLFIVLSSAKSCWPEISKAPRKRGLKYGGVLPNNQLETMALAGILAKGYDALKPWERRFLKISDNYDSGIIGCPELYSQLTMYCPRKEEWDRLKYFRIKRKLEHKVVVVNRKTNQ